MKSARRADRPADQGFGRFIRGVLLWLFPCFVVWFALTPFYNRFVQVSAENLLNLFEVPNVTRLVPQDSNTVAVTRTDFPPGRASVARVRTTDLHFPTILLAALFLAVPGISRQERWGNLGWVLLISVFFHIALQFFWVKFHYATQLGSWSLENYGAFSRNFWGLGKHLLDLPIKLGLPFALWAGFYLNRFTRPQGFGTSQGSS